MIYSGTHSYDAAGQLTGETLLPGVAPASVNLTQTFDRDNRLLTHQGAAATFDADGNLLSVASGLTPDAYSYDARNRLTSAGSLSYGYNAEDRRTAVTDASGTTRYTVNPNAVLDQVLVRTTPDGTKTFYVYGLGLLHEETSGTPRYYHFDRRGDTVALTDGAGAVTDRASYGVYGELLSRTGATNTPFLFNGQWGVQTDGNGLYYHRARYYHPQLRRFLNQDTVLGSITTSVSLNRFAYANGNPVTAIDPFGLAAVDQEPNDGPAKPPSYEGSINYAATGALLTYGRFEGEVTNPANPKESFLITGSLYGIGFQLGTINGTTDIVLRQDPNKLVGVANGGFFTSMISASAGFVSFGSVSQTVFMNNGTQDTRGRVDFDRPQFQMPSDTKLNDPKDILSIKPGIGISFGFDGIMIEKVVPVFIPPPKG